MYVMFDLLAMKKEMTLIIKIKYTLYYQINQQLKISKVMISFIQQSLELRKGDIQLLYFIWSMHFCILFFFLFLLLLMFCNYCLCLFNFIIELLWLFSSFVCTQLKTWNYDRKLKDVYRISFSRRHVQWLSRGVDLELPHLWRHFRSFHQAPDHIQFMF